MLHISLNHYIDNIMLDFYLEDNNNEFYNLVYEHQKDSSILERIVDINHSISNIKSQLSSYIKQCGDSVIIVCFDINIKVLSLLGILGLPNIHLRDISNFPPICFKHFELHTSTILDAFFKSQYRGVLKFKGVGYSKDCVIDILNRSMKKSGLRYDKISEKIGYIDIYIITLILNNSDYFVITLCMKVNKIYLFGQGIDKKEFAALSLAAEDLFRNINGKNVVLLKKETIDNMNKKGIK